MERLTKRGTRTKSYVSAIGSGVGCWGRIIDRLAAYENTGLEPEEIKELASALQARGSCETCIRYESRKQCPVFYGEAAATCLRERLCGCHDCQNGSKWVWRGTEVE